MKNVLIIGGGVAGLSAGIYAQMSGMHAVICEKHSVAGGNLTGWQRGEYHIDNCIHWLTGTHPKTKTYRMWETLGALGAEIGVYQPPVLYSYEMGGKTLSLHASLARFEGELLSLSPGDEKEIRALCHAVGALQGVFGVVPKTVPLFSAMKNLPLLWHYFRMCTGDLAGRFHHPLIRSFLSEFIGADFSALALLAVFANFCGGNAGLPVGGSRSMAERMCARFQKLGGELLLQKEAVRIHVRAERATAVTFSDGTSLEAEQIVLATDPMVAFRSLLGIPMPRAYQKQYEDPRLKRFSSLHCAFSLKGSAPFCGSRLIKLPEEYASRLHCKTLAVREFSHEKGFAPMGETVLEAMLFCDEQDARAFIALREKREAYEQKKQALGGDVLAVLQTVFPQKAEEMQLLDVWTPATYRRFTGAESGAWMTAILPPRFLPTPKSNRIRGLQNVVLATQYAQLPGGLPIAAEEGRRAILTLQKLREERKEREGAFGRMKKAF